MKIFQKNEPKSNTFILHIVKSLKTIKLNPRISIHFSSNTGEGEKVRKNCFANYYLKMESLLIFYMTIEIGVYLTGRSENLR